MPLFHPFTLNALKRVASSINFILHCNWALISIDFLTPNVHSSSNMHRGHLDTINYAFFFIMNVNSQHHESHKQIEILKKRQSNTYLYAYEQVNDWFSDTERCFCINLIELERHFHENSLNIWCNSLEFVAGNRSMFMERGFALVLCFKSSSPSSLSSSRFLIGLIYSFESFFYCVYFHFISLRKF